MSKRWEEMTVMERLAIKQALYKMLAADVATGKPDNLRGQADKQYKSMYMATGAKTYDVNVDGKKVGTFSVVAKESEEKAVVYILDANTYGDWLRDEDAAANAAVEWILADRKRAEAFARHIVETTGVIPDGCESFIDRTPSTLTTKFSRLDPQKVAAALGNALPSTIAGLLEG